MRWVGINFLCSFVDILRKGDGNVVRERGEDQRNHEWIVSRTMYKKEVNTDICRLVRNGRRIHDHELWKKGKKMMLMIMLLLEFYH